MVVFYLHMKKIKWLVPIIILVYLYFIKFPVIIDRCNDHRNSAFNSMKKGDKFRLSDKVKFLEEKKYTMVLMILDHDDVPDNFPFGKIFTTSDQDLVKNFLNVEFIYTNADVATIESEIFVYENDKCILRSAITLNKEGLQNFNFGWIVPAERGVLSSLTKKFNSNYSPVVILK